MPRYALPVLGLEIAISTDADAERVYDAKACVEKRFAQLNQGGKNVSREKLLTVLALSLADDYLQSRSELSGLEEKLNSLLAKMK